MHRCLTCINLSEIENSFEYKLAWFHLLGIINGKGKPVKKCCEFLMNSVTLLRV